MTTSSLSSLGGSSATSGSGLTNSAYNLKPTDFIKMMVTQLQHQDPTQPMTNQDLLSQISQIGQLQSSDTLQSTLASMQLQSQIGSGSSLLGKTVMGLDANKKVAAGVVNAVQVANGSVNLQLDSGTSIPLANVTAVGPAPVTPTN